MLSLIAAIQSAFNGNPAFSAFTNGLENGLAKDNSFLPNCLLIEVSSVNQYSTRNDKGVGVIETANIQFTVRSSSGTQVAQTLNALAEMLDHRPLNLNTANERVIDSRVVAAGKVVREDERVYRGDSEYQFMLCRTIQ